MALFTSLSVRTVSAGLLLAAAALYCILLTNVCLSNAVESSQQSNYPSNYAHPVQHFVRVDHSRDQSTLLDRHVDQPAVAPVPCIPVAPVPSVEQHIEQPITALVNQPVNQPVARQSEGKMITHSLLDGTNPGDSSITIHIISGRGDQSAPTDKMVYCTFTNIFVHHESSTGRSNVLLRVQNKNEHDRISQLSKSCWANGRSREPEPNFCRPCFHPQFTFDVLPYEYSQDVSTMPADQWETYRTLPDPFKQTIEPLASGVDPRWFSNVWSIHKWVRAQHIAHWAQKLVLFQSLYQHSSLFEHAVPNVDAMLFFDTDSQYSEHQAVILNASLASALDERSPLISLPDPKRWIWAPEIEARSKAASERIEKAVNESDKQLMAIAHTPITRLSFTPHYGIFSTHKDDTIQFRREVYRQMDLPALRQCPPRKTVLLYRHNRKILNQDAILYMLKNDFGIAERDIEVATVNEDTPSRDQVSLFASTGLMLSSHSSQLINVLFTQPSSAMIEVAPEFYNADFSEYAHGMGVFFQYALGGEVDPNDERRVDLPKHRECVSHLSRCHGYSYCFLKERWGCDAHDNANKNLVFFANLTAVRIAVQNSIGHLEWTCAGRWRDQR